MKNLKKVLALVLAFACAFTMFAGAVSYSDQADIKHSEAVNTLTSLGVLDGYEDGSFRPEATITRAEMAKMIYTIRNGGNANADQYKSMTTSFSDVNGTWAEGYIKYCQITGIIDGKSATSFDPNGDVTVVETAKMALVLMGYNASADRANLVGTGWDARTLALATTNGLMDDIVGSVNAPISRDEAAQLLYNTVGADCVLWSNDKEEFVKDGTTSTGGIMDYTTVGEKYLDLQDKKGILTSVKYDDSEDAYTTKVDSIKESFDATTDYSDLMGQEVQVLYKVVKDEQVLFGLYATEKNKTVSALANDADDIANLAAGKTVEIDNTDYDIDEAAKTVAPNGEDYKGNIAAYYNITLVDNDNDKDYEYIVVEPFTVAEVTTVAATKYYFTPIKGAVASYDDDKVNAYDGMEKDDVVAIVDKDYAVSGLNEVTEAESVSGTVAGLKGSDVLIDGTWYKKADVCDDIPENNKTAEISVVNGFYFKADNAADSIDDVALVLAAADDKNFASDNYDLKLLLSNGEVVTTVGYVDDENKSSPKEGSLYTYSKKSDYYKLTALTDGDQIDLDKGSINGEFDPDTGKLGATRVASDAIVMVKYENNKGAVVTGAEAAKWTGDDYMVSVAFTDTTVKLMAIDLNAAKLPNATDETMYGVILSEAYTTSNDDGDYVVFDMWTADGLVTDAKVDIEEIEDSDVNANNVTSKFTKNMAISYEMSGEEYVSVQSQTATGYVTGAITDTDGDYIKIATAKGVDEYKLTSDTVVLYVDTEDGTGSATGTIGKAAPASDTEYYANVMFILNDEPEDGYYEIKAIVIDMNGRLQDKDGKDVPVIKVK